MELYKEEDFWNQTINLLGLEANGRGLEMLHGDHLHLRIVHSDGSKRSDFL